MAKDLLKRYVWLVDTINTAGKITFQEISDKWQRSDLSDGEELPLRTFHNHKKAIRTLLEIDIKCEKRTNSYFISGINDIESDEVATWLINSFTVSNLIAESQSLKHRIILENIPSGQRYLSTIIKAMREGSVLNVCYQSYWKNAPDVFEVEPYFVKLFRQRWYVIGRSPYYDAIRVYSLDRFQKLELTKQSFCMPDNFDAEAFFIHSYGIISDDKVKATTVEIKVWEKQVRYLRDLPLHHSQSESLTSSDYSHFTFFLKPTDDFIQELLSQGDRIEVLRPKWLRNKFWGIVANMRQYYGE